MGVVKYVLASLFIFLPNRIWVCTCLSLMAFSSKFCRMMQLRVTLPSRGGSGMGAGGSLGVSLTLATLVDFLPRPLGAGVLGVVGAGRRGIVVGGLGAGVVGGARVG